MPYLGQVKLFEIPGLSYLGFPPFARECSSLYHWLRGRLLDHGGVSTPII